VTAARSGGATSTESFTTETAATIRFALVRSTPDGETYAAGIAPDGTLTHITADLASDDVEDILEGRANIADFEYDEPSEGQVEAWERDGWETGPRLVELETRMIVYVTHPDGSPALWMETASDGTRTLIDDGKTPVVLALGEDVDEAVAAWRAAVGDDEAGR
jgi:hypothetical protein